MPIKTILALLLCTSLLAGCASSGSESSESYSAPTQTQQLPGSFTFVENGKAKAVIVISDAAFKAEIAKPYRGVPTNSDSKIKLAATDLQTYIKKISGATLPILSDTSPLSESAGAILVGSSKYTSGAAIPQGITNRRAEEGFVIQLTGNRLLLAGNDAGPYWGSYYAVCDWLNQQGVRWIMPTEFGEIVPQNPTIFQNPVSTTDKPGFKVRSWWCNQTAEMGYQEALWKLRNKLTIEETEFVGIPGDSYLRYYMPDEKLAASRPEIFGKNLNGTVNPHMPNLSSPEAAKLVADKVIAKIKEDEAKAKEGKGLKPFSLGFAPDDGYSLDFSEKTMKEMNQGFPDWIGREGVVNEASISEEWFIFMNRVTEEVKKTYPDFIITTNGYANRANPPEGVKLDPNLGVMFAYIWADTTKPMNSPKSWHGAVVGAQMKKWASLSETVFLYEYHLSMLVTALTPVPQVRKHYENYKLMKEWGVDGFFNEARQPYFEEGIVTRYIRTKLFWNPDQPLEPLLQDYYRNWYGPAAAPSRAFWTHIEDALLESPMLGHEDRILPYVYSKPLLDQLEKDVAAAEKLALKEPYATRVKVDRLTLEHLKQYMAYKDAEYAADYAGAVAQLNKMADTRETLGKISPFLTVRPTSETNIVAGDFYWGTMQRRDYFQKVADNLNGKTGSLVALAPKSARFTLDPASVGKDLRWHDPEFNRAKWRDLDATIPFYAQGYMGPRGVPYTGKMWYVFEVDVPADAIGKPIKLFTPIVACEAWTWVNGQYAGHRPYLEAYISPSPIELDVTNLVKPGKNTLAFWVSTGTGKTQASDGFLGRVVLYSPK
jgi:hypothetical protein